MTDERLIAIRRAGKCRVCGKGLETGTRAHWDSATRSLVCLSCLGGESTAGGSAQREFERRRDLRQQRVLAAHPKLGRLQLALSKERQTTVAFERGAQGEARVARVLAALAIEGVSLIHDRQLPGTRGNIDHIAVTPSGVFVIDTKNYKGKVEKRNVGGWLRSVHHLYVGGRDKHVLLEGVRHQAQFVSEVVARAAAG